MSMVSSILLTGQLGHTDVSPEYLVTLWCGVHTSCGPLEPYPEGHTFDLQHVCGEICRACGLDISAAAKLRDCLPACQSYPPVTEAQVCGKKRSSAAELPGRDQAGVHLATAQD